MVILQLALVVASGDTMIGPEPRLVFFEFIWWHRRTSMRSIGANSDDLGGTMSLSTSSGVERRRRFLGRSPFPVTRRLLSWRTRTGDPNAPLRTLTARAMFRFRKGSWRGLSGVIMATSTLVSMRNGWCWKLYRAAAYEGGGVAYCQNQRLRCMRSTCNTLSGPTACVSQVCRQGAA